MGIRVSACTRRESAARSGVSSGSSRACVLVRSLPTIVPVWPGSPSPLTTSDCRMPRPPAR
eukprot:2992157-Prymnesium_polylepis.1